MARQTFTWKPDHEESLSQDPTVHIAKFGDGYEQRSATGLNNAPEKWSLSFTVGGSSTPAALAFVQDKKAVDSFYWTNPYGVTKVYVCRSWKVSRRPGYQVVTMEFEQVFEA